jgi:hypothetical protein
MPAGDLVRAAFPASYLVIDTYRPAGPFNTVYVVPINHRESKLILIIP